MNLQTYKSSNKANNLTIVLFIIYLISLIWIILFKFNIHFSNIANQRSINLIPFGKPLILNGKTDFGELILNVLIFAPLGLYAGILFKKLNNTKIVLSFLLISLMFEGFQFILRIGAFDITDLINNTVGGIIGLIIYKGLEKVLKDSVKAQKFINILATLSTTLIIVLILWLKINNLWVFRM